MKYEIFIAANNSSFVGDSAGFAKDIETTISAIASYIKKDPETCQLVLLRSSGPSNVALRIIKQKFLFSHKFSNRDKVLLHIQDKYYG